MSAEARHIAIVDADARSQEALRRYLTREQYVVHVADGARALDKLISHTVLHLIVLDAALRDGDGFVVCRRLRTHFRDHTPVVMTNGNPSDTECILGLEVGADDYLRKPYTPRELLARIQAIFRRGDIPPEEDASLPRITEFGPYRFAPEDRILTKDGQPLIITPSEAKLLDAFLSHPRVPLSRNEISLLIRGREFIPPDRSLDVLISRLRRAIEQDTRNPRYIQTVQPSGYVFIPDAPTSG